MADFPSQFRPGKLFQFPKRTFGSKGCTRSFRAEWCDSFNWLHYDVGKDVAFCYLCMRAQHEKKFLASTKRDPAFISKGFSYWKEGTSAFAKHASSACHREATQALVVLPQTAGDVGELLSTAHGEEKAENRKMFRVVLQNIRFLARQGLALRGDGDESNSNFVQLFRLRGVDHPLIDKWMQKSTNKYTSNVVQNECLELMALSVLRKIGQSMHAAIQPYFSVLADECTDCSNTEQFTICIRWVDNDLNVHEEFLGLHKVATIDAESLVRTVKDVLLRFNLKMSDCRGQCYDGASNMSGARKGVATQLTAEESRALYTHCYGHALNLAVSDTIKKSTICRDSLDVAFEIARLIKFSPKRNAALDSIKASDNDSDSATATPAGIRSFCSTRWTVRGDSLASILNNYTYLSELWDQCLQSSTRLEPDVKARIIGVQAQMSTFKLLFGVKLSERILKMTDNLSRTLQKSSLSASEAQQIASLTKSTLSSMRSDSSFELFFASVECLRAQHDVELPTLPRKRRMPRRFDDGDGHHADSVEEHYRQLYFEAIDLATSSINDRFDQPGYRMYQHLETVLVHGAAGEAYDDDLPPLLDLYTELDEGSLRVQLTALEEKFKDSGTKPDLDACLTYLRGLSSAAKSYFDQVCILVKLIIVMPATNAVSERSFSTMRRIKTYLRSTMGQARLNHTMVLAIHKARLDSLDLTTVANDFVEGHEYRLRNFGKFT